MSKIDYRNAAAPPTAEDKRKAARNCQWILLGACFVLVAFGWYLPSAIGCMFNVGFSVGKWVQRWTDRPEASGKHI